MTTRLCLITAEADASAVVPYTKEENDVIQSRITPITTAGCFAAIMVVAAFLSAYVPFFAFVGFLIMPIPLAIIYMRFGGRMAVMMAVVASILMSIFLTPSVAFFVILAFGGAGMILGAGFRHDWSPLKMLAGVTAAWTVSFISGLVFTVVLTGYDVAQLSQDWMGLIDTIINDVIANADQEGMTGVQLAQVKALFRSIIWVLPLIFCLGMSVWAFVLLKLSHLIMNRLGYPVKPFLAIQCWEIPRNMLYLYVLAQVMEYWGTSRSIDVLNIAGMNVEALSGFFICIQGVAFVSYLLNRHFSISPFFQAIIIIWVFIIPVLQVFVFIAGVIDMIMGYRRKQNAA